MRKREPSKPGLSSAVMSSQSTLAGTEVPDSAQSLQGGVAVATVAVANATPPQDRPNAPDAPRQPGLGNDLQAVIGQQLRAVYQEVVSEPVPDRFVQLLAELAKKEAGRS